MHTTVLYSVTMRISRYVCIYKVCCAFLVKCEKMQISAIMISGDHTCIAIFEAKTLQSPSMITLTREFVAWKQRTQQCP